MCARDPAVARGLRIRVRRVRRDADAGKFSEGRVRATSGKCLPCVKKMRKKFEHYTRHNDKRAGGLRNAFYEVRVVDGDGSCLVCSKSHQQAG